MSRLYRYLLVLYPQPFRDEFAPDMADLFDRQLREVAVRGESRWLFVLAAVRDVLVQSVLVRFDGGRARTVSSRRSKRAGAWDSVEADLRSAVRSLRTSPAVTLVALATLSLGIGATTAVYSVVRSVLLQPLPYPEPERIVRVFDTRPEVPEFALAPANFLDHRDAVTALDPLAAYHRGDAEITLGERPEQVTGMLVTSEFFRVVGVAPIIGTTFTRDHEIDANRNVAILSERFWDERFQRDRDVIGTKLVIDREPHTILGVVPASLKHVGGRFRSLPYGTIVDIWRPFVFEERPVRRAHYLNGIGRLAPGVDPEAGAAAMNVVAERLEREYPDTNEGWRIALMPLHDEVVRDARPTLLVLFAAVAVVLAIACVNVANLLLVRGASRQRELALRTALGASRPKLVVQLLTESVLLACSGGALGLLVSAALVRWLSVLAGEGIPRIDVVAIDGGVVAFAVITTLVTGVLFGALPALRLSGARVSLAHSRSSDSREERRARDAFAVAQLALAIVLVVGAGLLVRTLVNLQRSEPGFRPERVLTAKVTPPPAKYPEGADTARLFERVVERFANVPDVVAAGAGSSLPWSGYDENFGFQPEGRPEDRFGARYHFATPGYFRALGTPLVHGRTFERTDDANAPPRVVVNEQLARDVWRDVDPVGSRISFSSDPAEQDFWTVVGVVGDVKDQPGDERAKAAIYMPFSQQQWTRRLVLVVRTHGEPSDVVATLRSEIAAIDPDLPLAEIQTLDDISQRAFAKPRFLSWLTSAFALFAVGLAVLGLYGVISHAVSRETRAIAIRMAVGARTRDVVGDVLRRSLWLVAVGGGVGVVAAVAAARSLDTILYGVAPYDPVTLAAVTLVLGGTILFASVGPARRASRVDPMQTLRSD